MTGLGHRYDSGVTVTYGERMLAGVEGKRRRVMAKRRALTLLVPSLIASGWSTSALIATRNERLATEGAGLLRLIADPALPVLWTALFVLLPLWWALKPEPLPAGAGLAFMAGPVMTPILFGAGGWHPWQIAMLAAVTWLVLGAAAARARRFPPGRA